MSLRDLFGGIFGSLSAGLPGLGFGPGFVAPPALYQTAQQIFGGGLGQGQGQVRRAYPHPFTYDTAAAALRERLERQMRAMSILDYIKDHVPHDHRFFGVYWHLENDIEGRPRYMFLTSPGEGMDFELYRLEPNGSVFKVDRVEENEVEHDHAGRNAIASMNFLESLDAVQAFAFAKAVTELACSAVPDHRINGFRIKFKDGKSFLKFCEMFPGVLSGDQ